MVAKIDLISEASHKHAGEVVALAFDGEHLYSGSEDGVISVRILAISCMQSVDFLKRFSKHKVFQFFILQSSFSFSHFFINRPQLNAC